MPVEVLGTGDPNTRRILTPTEDFLIPSGRVHQITRAGAMEYVCTTPNGFRICVFFRPGMQ